jgi:hypothetical protein
MVHPTDIQSHAIDLPRWQRLINRIQTAGTPIDALETAAEAEGYLYCLHDVGLIGFYQRNKMASQLKEACARQLERTRPV